MRGFMACLLGAVAFIFLVGCVSCVMIAGYFSTAQQALTDYPHDIERDLRAALTDAEGVHFYSARIEGDTLVLRVRFDKRDELASFLVGMAAIHGAVIRSYAEVDFVRIHELSGQQTTIPFDAMKDYYYHRITWEQYVSPWQLSNW